MPFRSIKLYTSLAVVIIVFSALLIRIWGIGWDHLYPRHHDEQIHLHCAITFSNGELSPKTIWLPSRYPKYVLYPWLSMYLVAGVIAIWEMISDWGSLLLAFPGMLVGPGSGGAAGLEMKQVSLLIGRLTVACFGTATVWILYRIGRQLWSRRIGLLAAAFLAFTGYHVANCHWLKNDVITLFFTVLALWLIVGIYRTGKWKYYLLAALASALAINSKFHVFPIFFVLLAAPGLREGRGWKGFLDRRLLVSLPLFLAGMALSFPVLYLDFDFFRSNILSYLTTMPASYLLEGGAQMSFFTIRFYNLVNMFRFSAMMEHGMGIYLTLLGVGGLIMALVKKDRRLKLIAVFPVIYLIVAVLMASPGLRLQDTMPLYPFAALLASVLLAAVCDRLIRKKWLNRILFTLIGLGLLSPYVISMLRMDYGYWQPDTSIWATQWADKNIPDGSRVAREKKTLDLIGNRHVVATKRRLCDRPVTAYRDQDFRYLITSSRQENRMTDKFGLYGPDHPFGRFYTTIESEYNLLKIFDLGVIPYKGGIIKIYELDQPYPLTPAGLDSDLLRYLGHVYSLQSPRILFLDREGRCQGNTGFSVPPESKRDRLLISPLPLPEIAVQVVNGPREGTIRIWAGGKKISADFAAGQVRQFLFPAATAFPFIRYSYRVEAASAWNSPCRVRILTDPFRIGLGYLETEEYGKAIRYLEAADQDDWLTHWLLARLYRLRGETEKERTARHEVSRLVPGFETIKSRLEDSGRGIEIWREDFQKYTGYSSDWLSYRLAVTDEMEDLITMPPAPNGNEKFHTPDIILGPGKYRFVISTPLPRIQPETKLCRLTLRDDYQVIFSRDLSGKDFPAGVFSFPLESTGQGTAFSAELETALPLREAGFTIRFIPSIRSWLEKLVSRKTPGEAGQRD